MKNRIILAFTIIMAYSYSCSESFMEKTPLGVTSEDVFYNEKGANALLTGAYALVDGQGNVGTWSGSTTNWVWGSVASDDAYKGSEPSDQSAINSIERYETLPSNSYVSGKWAGMYDGVSRCNDVMKVLKKAKELGNIEEDAANLIEAQAKFLRGFYHFELKRIYNNIPYITDEVEDPAKVTNTIDAWPLIEADLEFAVNYLPESQLQVGRATKYTAEALLARAHLFQKEYTSAKPLLDDIINSNKYSLVDCFFDNYKIEMNNNVESIFEIQYVVNDGTYGSTNGGYGDALNFPMGGDIGTCCGFHQPSQNLVNAFKVDPNGLPMFDTFNDTNLFNDYNVSSSDVFIPDDHLVDPRLDWTVGRRGIPFLDWGVMRGADWIRDQGSGGPYLYKKNMFYKSQKGTLSTSTGWATGVNANNYRMIRYAHVLLWRAEVAVEENDLEKARELVNMIRARAANCVVMGRVTDYTMAPGDQDYATQEANGTIDWNQPAANYLVSQYTTSFPSQEYARKAVQWELRLEFAMEGQRFFDLVRWNIAAQTLNAYIAKDSQFRSFLTGASFDTGKDEYEPIPQSEIDLQNAEEEILVQNEGY
jgi:hypothetical protein